MKKSEPIIVVAAALALSSGHLQGSVMLGTNDQFTTSLPANGNLQIAGDLSVTLGIDLGTSFVNSSLPGVQIDYYAGTEKAVKFDIIDASGSFQWRDNLGATVRNKMTLDGSNVLRVFNSAGSASGVSLDGNSGVISLSGSASGISANGTPVFSLDSSGNVNFATTRPMSIAAATASTSSTTGALTVSGGIGAGSDSHFNGVRVGRGGGNIGSNTAVGTSALGSNTTGFNSVAMGAGALALNTSGYNHSSFGAFSLYNNTNGVNNTVMGSYAAYFNTTGSNNSAMGVSALQANQTGSNNTALGYDALFKNQTGSGNVAVGMTAGKFRANGQDLTSISNSIFIGYYTKAADNANTNSVVIGNSAIGEGSNTTVIGNSSTTSTHLYGQTKADSLKVNGQTDLNNQVIVEPATAPDTAVRAMRVLADGTILVKPGGNLSMGNFTAGAQP